MNLFLWRKKRAADSATTKSARVGSWSASPVDSLHPCHIQGSSRKTRAFLLSGAEVDRYLQVIEAILLLQLNLSLSL